MAQTVQVMALNDKTMMTVRRDHVIVRFP